MLVGLMLLLLGDLRATIVGLNQIVTPDIQPAGVLGVGYQIEHAHIGNSQQVQFELGLSPRFELAWFQGVEPGEGLVSTEFNLLQHGPHLVTAGVINWSTRGGDAQPVMEYGYYADTDHFVIGGIYANRQPELLLGYKRMVSEKFQVSVDFQGGTANAFTVGFTYNFTPTLSVAPALYLTNTHPRHLLGYVVFTWNLTVWK
jgi:hypothetical protein